MVNLCPNCQFIERFTYQTSDEEIVRLVRSLASSSAALTLNVGEIAISRTPTITEITIPVTERSFSLSSAERYMTFFGFVQGLFALNPRVRVSHDEYMTFRVHIKLFSEDRSPAMKVT
jgi:hypothetical protein